MTTVSNNIKLASGNTACLTMTMDPIVPDWTSGECIRFLLKTIDDCEVDGGMSTGGEYNPIETGASQFTVKVVESTDPSEAAADATLTNFDADNSVISRGVHTSADDVLECYSFDPAVLSNDLIVFLYNFCAINEPSDSTIPVNFDATKDYKFISGNTARFSMHLDAALTNWEPNICIYFMLRIVQLCDTADGYNTGGRYKSQAEHYESEWSITILGPLGEDGSSTEIAAGGSLAARQTSAEAYCFGHSEDHGDLALPITWAMQAVVDFCEKFDGEIMAQESVRQYTIQLIQPNVWIAVRARRTSTLWDAGCRRSFDIILNACHAEDWFFFGGQHQDELRIYTLGVQNPAEASAITRIDDQDATNTVSSAEIATDSTLPPG